MNPDQNMILYKNLGILKKSTKLDLNKKVPNLTWQILILGL